jgi:hypothetical protein
MPSQVTDGTLLLLARTIPTAQYVYDCLGISNNFTTSRDPNMEKKNSKCSTVPSINQQNPDFISQKNPDKQSHGYT